MSPILLVIVPVVLGSKLDTTDLGKTTVDVAKRRGSLRLLTAEEMFVKRPLATSQEIVDCGASDECLARVLRAYEADLGLLILINTEVDPALVSLRLLDTRTGRRLDDHVEPVETAASVISQVAALMEAMLNRAEHPAWGRVRVRTVPADARVVVEHESGAIAAEILPPGRYVARAERSGYEPAAPRFEVAPGDDVSLTLELPEQQSIFERPWLWVAVGAVAVVVGSVAIGVASRPSTACVCLGGPGTCEPC